MRKHIVKAKTKNKRERRSKAISTLIVLASLKKVQKRV